VKHRPVKLWGYRQLTEEAKEYPLDCKAVEALRRWLREDIEETPCFQLEHPLTGKVLSFMRQKRGQGAVWEWFARAEGHEVYIYPIWHRLPWTEEKRAKERLRLAKNVSPNLVLRN
jgi:hypothetical protein